MQHSPPATFDTKPVPGAGWRNIVKALPGVPWLRRRLWSQQWSRVVMNRECRQWVEALGPERLKVLEISGQEWGSLYSFKEYHSTDYPDYDVCQAPLPQTFDLVIAEQVFEHLLWPYRAGRNVYQMLNPGGHFLVSTPFLIKIHGHPIDCSRWTELGLKHLLAECGFPLERIRTSSWGNRACVKANFRSWTPHRWWRSLRNEPDFPCTVWALAEKEPTGSTSPVSAPAN
jgi:SAM-dependent methyltransferase